MPYTLTQSEKAALRSLNNAQLLAIVREDSRRMRGGVPTSDKQLAEAAEARTILYDRQTGKES
jgi:hypothetical protein